MNLVNKVTFQVGKHSPLILTVGGVLGLGATAVLSYKAAKKVEVIVEDIETNRQQEEIINAYNEIPDGAEISMLQTEEYERVNEVYSPLNKQEVVRNIAGAVALPVATGIASIACISLSYYILNNRNNMLATALGTAMAEYRFYRNRVKETYGEEVEQRMGMPVELEKRKVKGDDGKKVDVDTPLYRRSLTGEWFNQSSEYAIDDPSYNEMFLKSCEEKLTQRIFRKGVLRMNEVNDMLGFPRTQFGETLGWSAGDFALDTQITRVTDSDGWVHPEIYVKWTEPRSIYNDVEYEGRYAY